jgi:hypothetical protein
MAQANLSNRVFNSFDAMHVTSDADVVLITQGNQTLKLPASLVPVLIVALNLAAEGEI